MNNSNNKRDNVTSLDGTLPSSDWNVVAGEFINATSLLGGPDDTDNQLERLLSYMTYMIVHRDISSGPNQLRIDINLKPILDLKDAASFKFIASRTYNPNPTCILGTNAPKSLITPTGDDIKENVIVEGGLYMLYYKEAMDKFVVYGLANNAGGADNNIWRGFF